MRSSKVLVTVANYGTANDRYLARLMAEYQAMSFSVDVVVLSNVTKRLLPHSELRIVDLQGEDPWSLPFAHKKVLAERVDDYDLFIYSEDDILFTELNVRAFLDLSSVLPSDELLGFLRFEEAPNGERNYPDVHGHFHWDPKSVRRGGQDLVLAHFTNEHSGCYALTQPQLRRCLTSGGFMVNPHRGRYGLAETAATDPYTQCGFRKVICISHIDSFLVHHLPNKYIGSEFGINDTELRRQMSCLRRFVVHGPQPGSLLNTESKLGMGLYSKNYYEPASPTVLSLVPSTADTVLSLGCGWGALEARLAENGLRVTAVPLDPVIPGGICDRGVEVVSGELEDVLLALCGRQFGCILLSHVLHLVPDPIHLLRSIRKMLSPDGILILSLPNMSSLAVDWHRFVGDHCFSGLRTFNQSGVQFTSFRSARQWIVSSGMTLERTVHLPSPRTAKLTKATFGLLDPLLSSEFVLSARPGGDPNNNHREFHFGH